MEGIRYKKVAELFCKILAEYAVDMGQSEVATYLGTSQPTISRIKKGEMLPPDNVIDTIRENWGIDIKNDVDKARRESSRIANRGSKKPTITMFLGVPYYNIDFLGGFDLVVNDQTIMPDYYIDFKPYENATCWCNITGHSMEPEINQGDIIALKKIDDTSFLPFGEIYAIVTRNDMRTVKRLGPGSTKDTFTLIPANKCGDYAPQEIKKSDILYIYKVMGCMKRF